MELHLHGLHRRTPSLLQIHHCLSCCGSSLQTVYFHPYRQHNHFSRAGQTLPSPCLSKHRVLSHITSNRGSEFVSHFFRSLGKALDIRLHFTSSYHPEGDGQTERMNQTLEQYLYIACNYQQDNWSELLPLAEILYNT